VKEHLDEKGYAGIRYMETAEQYLERVGPIVVKRKVESKMNRALRRYGLK